MAPTNLADSQLAMVPYSDADLKVFIVRMVIPGRLPHSHLFHSMSDAIQTISRFPDSWKIDLESVRAEQGVLFAGGWNWEDRPEWAAKVVGQIKKSFSGRIGHQ